MNLIILILVFLVVVFIYDLFIPRYNDEAVERVKSRNNTYIVGDFILSIIVFLGISFLFTLLVKNYLLNADCYTVCMAQTDCLCIFENSLLTVTAILIQILNIASFYQIFIHSYSYFAKLRDRIFKFVVAALALITAVAGEMLISSINLDKLSFASNDLWMNFFLNTLVYGAVIVFPLLVLYAILTDHYFSNKDSDDEYKPARAIKEKEIFEDKLYNDYEDYYQEEDYSDIPFPDESDEEEEISSDYYY